MAELKVLTDKILIEAENKAKEILTEAENKAKNIEQSHKKQSDEKYNTIVSKGLLEAESLKERLKSNAHLKSRDSELKVKQEVIKRVYEAALKDLENMDTDKYLDYIEKNASFNKESILIVVKDKLNDVKNKFPTYKVSEDRFVESGFVEIYGGIEKNFTFDTQIEYIKDELQGEIAKVLFK